MEKADVLTDLVPEILDIVELLVKYAVIEEKTLFWRIKKPYYYPSVWVGTYRTY